MTLPRIPTEQLLAPLPIETPQPDDTDMVRHERHEVTRARKQFLLCYTEARKARKPSNRWSWATRAVIRRRWVAAAVADAEAYLTYVRTVERPLGAAAANKIRRVMWHAAEDGWPFTHPYGLAEEIRAFVQAHRDELTMMLWIGPVTAARLLAWADGATP